MSKYKIEYEEKVAVSKVPDPRAGAPTGTKESEPAAVNETVLEAGVVAGITGCVFTGLAVAGPVGALVGAVVGAIGAVIANEAYPKQ